MSEEISFIADEFVSDGSENYSNADDEVNHNTERINREINELIVRQQDYENKINNFRNEISEQSKDILLLEDMNLELRKEKDDVVQQSKIERDKLLTRIELCEFDKDELSKAVEKAKENIESLQNEIRHLQKENLELHQVVEEKCSEIEILESQTKELLQMEKSLFELKEEEPIELQLDSTGHLSHRPSLENGNEPGESLFHEIYEATKQTEFNSKLGDVQFELSAAQDENYRLQNEKLAIETQIIDLKNELDAKKSEIQVLQIQLSDMKKQFESKVPSKSQACQTMIDCPVSVVSKSKPITTVSVGIGTESVLQT